jgi:hypothetical protein
LAEGLGFPLFLLQIQPMINMRKTKTKQYHPKDYYTQKWINNPKMGLPLPPTPMEDTNHRNHHQHGTSGLTGSQLMNFRWLTKQTKISAYLNSFLEDLGFQV